MSQCWTSVRARKVRVTRLDNCANPPAALAANGFAVTDGFISIEYTPEYEDGDEFIQKNANGELCVNDRSCDVFKRFTLAITFCGVDPDMLSLMTGNPVEVDAAGASVGFRVQEGLVCGDFALEAWSGIPGLNCGVNEVQRLTVGGAGLTSFTITYAGQTTASIDDAASAGAVQDALEALSNIGGGDVSVTGADGGPWTIEFTGALAHTNVAAVTTTPTGGSGVVTVVVIQNGSGTGTASGYFLLPHVKNGTLQAFTLENGAATFVINGWTDGVTGWGAGPYNVVAGAALGAASSLIDPVIAGDHMLAFLTTVDPPAASCGTQPMPASPVPAV